MACSDVQGNDILPSLKSWVSCLILYDITHTTTFKFMNYEKLKSQKEQMFERLIEMLTESNSLKRKEIADILTKEFESCAETVYKYLSSWKKEMIIKTSKFGVYTLVGEPSK